MKRLPPLKSLHVFLVAARNQSFKLAAEQLHVSQAAVSQQIRLLEDYFQESLFEREGKQTRLSSKGQLLFPYIEQAFEQIHQGINAVDQQPNPNALCITATHSFTSLFLGTRISDFQQNNQELSVQFAPNNNLTNFVDDQVELGIRRGKGEYAGLESRLLFDDSILLVASPLLFAKLNIDVEQLSLQQVLTMPLLADISSDITEAVSDCCHRGQVDVDSLNCVLQTTDAVPIIQSALAGQGIAFVSKMLAVEHIQNGLLINPLDYSYHSSSNLYLVAPEHHFKWHKIQVFERWLREQVATLLT